MGVPRAPGPARRRLVRAAAPIPGSRVLTRAPGAATLLAIAASASAQTPTFSTGVEAIRVDVLVTDGGRPLLGLAPSDFEVRDNGVLQDVEFVAAERLPLDVILALDASRSVAGEPLEHLRAAGRALLERLEPEDQAALLTFSHEVTLWESLTHDVERIGEALARVEPRGQTAVIDAAYAGMMLGEADAGRDLMIVFSDGVDTSSWLTAEQVVDAARYTDVVVYGVSLRGVERPQLLEDLSELTGGSILEVDSTHDVGAAFVRIFDEFRRRYLLSYAPSGVSRGGWHELEVKVRGHRAEVRARVGYMAQPGL